MKKAGRGIQIGIYMLFLSTSVAYGQSLSHIRIMPAAGTSVLDKSYFVRNLYGKKASFSFSAEAGLTSFWSVRLTGQYDHFGSDTVQIRMIDDFTKDYDPIYWNDTDLKTYSIIASVVMYVLPETFIIHPYFLVGLGYSSSYEG